MCRSKANGGRRCSGQHESAGPRRVSVVTNKRSYDVLPGAANVAWERGEKVISIEQIDGDPGMWKTEGPLSDTALGLNGSGERESYAGTSWQGYDEYQQRSAELDRRVAAGESITEIMRAEQIARGKAQIERIAREGR